MKRNTSSATARAANHNESFLFQQMMEDSPINVMRSDRDFVIRYMNAASKKTLGKIAHLLPCKVEDVVGKSLDIFHKDPARARRILGDPRNLPHQAPPDRSRSQVSRHHRVSDGRQDHYCEWQIPRSDGIYPRRDQGKEPQHVRWRSSSQFPN